MWQLALSYAKKGNMMTDKEKSDSRGFESEDDSMAELVARMLKVRHGCMQMYFACESALKDLAAYDKALSRFNDLVDELEGQTKR